MAGLAAARDNLKRNTDQLNGVYLTTKYPEDKDDSDFDARNVNSTCDASPDKLLEELKSRVVMLVDEASEPNGHIGQKDGLQNQESD